MEGEKVIESLDCLWFFSNVMHAPKTHPIEVPSSKEEPKVENVEKVKVETEPIMILEAKRDASSFEMISKNGGLRSRDEKESSGERKVRKATKKRNKKDVKVNMGDYEKELGFDFRFDLSELLMMIEGYERFNKKKCGEVMPPLSDGMAMKQHLKSWAYAVACNVR
ncbi:hypothetical protein ACET3Z_005259 [Daucus carota]